MSKDDRHNADRIDLQRQILSLPTVNFPSDYSFRILNADSALSLRDSYHTGNHDYQEKHHQDERDWAYLARGAGWRNERIPDLNDGPWDATHNADSNDHGSAIANSSLGDLVTDPHEEHGTRTQGNHCDDLKPDPTVRN